MSGVTVTVTQTVSLRLTVTVTVNLYTDRDRDRDHHGDGPGARGQGRAASQRHGSGASWGSGAWIWRRGAMVRYRRDPRLGAAWGLKLPIIILFPGTSRCRLSHGASAQLGVALTVSAVTQSLSAGRQSQSARRGRTGTVHLSHGATVGR